jgi:hypothetical protein
MTNVNVHTLFRGLCTLGKREQISSPFIDRLSWLGPVKVTAQAKIGAILEINFSDDNCPSQLFTIAVHTTDLTLYE